MDSLPAAASTLESLSRERYGGAPVTPGPGSDVVEAMLRHRSVRAYRPDPLPPGTIQTLIAAASSAPTSSNLQTWSVVAVEDAGRRERLSVLAANQGFIRQAPLFLVWLADLSRLDRVGEANGRKLEGLAFLEMFTMALIDAALAAQNALVAAESLGLGTVYVGAVRNRPEQVASELALPPNAFAAFGMSVGHPDLAVATAIKPRLPQSLVLHREQYDAREEPDLVAGYEAALTRFSEMNGMGREGWLGRVLKRVAAPSSLAGRDRIREALTTLGFGLR